MIKRAAWAIVLAVWTAFSPMFAVAQESDTSIAAEATNDAEVPADESFEKFAERAEVLAARDDLSLFAIGRLRGELVTWRDQFLADTNINAGRVATVDAQIAALGLVPESGEEPASVAARRAALITQRQDLIAPALLAQEAYARANGLINEFDAITQSRQTAALTIRNPAPLNPTHLAAGLGAVVSLLEAVRVEIGVGISRLMNNANSSRDLPRFFVLLAIGLGLLTMGRRVITRWRNSLPMRNGRLGVLQSFVLSVVQIIVPVLGLVAVTESLEGLDILGLRGSDMLDMLPAAGMTVIFGWWLSRHIFPERSALSFLGHTVETRAKGRRYAAAIAWLMALSAMIDAGLRTIDRTDGTNSALSLIPMSLLAWLLWQLAGVFGSLPTQIGDEEVSVGRMRSLLARASKTVAVATPILAVLGYFDAARSLLVPTIFSLGLIGVVVVLQRLANDLTPTAKDPEDNRGLFALLPVIISFCLFLLSLPLFALIWGASDDNLREIWTRFSEGLSLGETRISPTDFLRFAAVFIIGYLLTRFIQGTLRKSVLPRTRLDIGGQNAIVAGFGYLGILIAAIVAITSAGIDLSNIAIVAGALSVGIGFGLQNIVSNFVSGIILLIERPVSEGDWIEVGGQMGYVRAISVRSTRIETFDRTDVIIPNADLVSGQVTNWTRGNLVGRVIVPVGVA